MPGTGNVAGPQVLRHGFQVEALLIDGIALCGGPPLEYLDIGQTPVLSLDQAPLRRRPPSAQSAASDGGDFLNPA